MRGEARGLLVGRHRGESTPPDGVNRVTKMLRRIERGEEPPLEEVQLLIAQVPDGSERVGRAYAAAKLNGKPQWVDHSIAKREEDEKRFLLDNHWQEIMENGMSEKIARECIRNEVLGPQSLSAIEKTLDVAYFGESEFQNLLQLLRDDPTKQMRPLVRMACSALQHHALREIHNSAWRTPRGGATDWWVSFQRLISNNADQISTVRLSELFEVQQEKDATYFYKIWEDLTLKEALEIFWTRWIDFVTDQTPKRAAYAQFLREQGFTKEPTKEEIKQIILKHTKGSGRDEQDKILLEEFRQLKSQTAPR